jgi:NAD(P)-dependent dehydrogenase (short-subunit alcohol dehydrogenase family)
VSLKCFLTNHTSFIQVTIPEYGEDSIRGTGTYVIAGGLGGLGRELCRWMAKHAEGVNVVVLSRGSNQSEAKLKNIETLTAELKKLGATLHVVACDVGVEDDVKNAIEWCKKSLPPIRGIVQGAMVLRVSTAQLVLYCNSWLIFIRMARSRP